MLKKQHLRRGGNEDVRAVFYSPLRPELRVRFALSLPTLMVCGSVLGLFVDDLNDGACEVDLVRKVAGGFASVVVA